MVVVIVVAAVTAVAAVAVVVAAVVVVAAAAVVAVAVVVVAAAAAAAAVVAVVAVLIHCASSTDGLKQKGVTVSEKYTGCMRKLVADKKVKYLSAPVMATGNIFRGGCVHNNEP